MPQIRKKLNGGSTPARIDPGSILSHRHAGAPGLCWNHIPDARGRNNRAGCRQLLTCAQSGLTRQPGAILTVLGAGTSASLVDVAGRSVTVSAAVAAEVTVQFEEQR